MFNFRQLPPPHTFVNTNCYSTIYTRFFNRKNNSSSESGRTLTEMLGVLAIMGVLTIGGIAGFNWAMDRWRANRIIDGVEERALVGSRLRLSGMNRTMEIADAVVAQTGGTIEDYATTVSNTGKNDEKTYFSVQVAGVSPQVCENVMNLNWQLPVEVYAGNTQYTGDTAICAGEGTVDLTFVFAADLITKKNVQVVDRNNPTCRPTQVWTCKENEDNHYNCCTAGMLCLADGEELPQGVSSANKGNCPRGTHQCRNNQCVCRKSCPAGQNQDPKTCACSSQICETGVWNEAKGECVECIQSSDCQDLTKPVCNTANNTCEACSKDLKGELFGDCGKCNSFGMAGKNTAAEIPACKTCSSSTNYLFRNAADGTTNSCGICKDGKPESTAATNTTRFEYNEQTGMCIDKCPRVAISDALTITRYGIYGNNTHMALWKNETECTYVFKITGKHVGLCTDCGATGTIPNGKCYYGSVEKETSPPRQGPKTVPFEIENAFSVSPGKFAKVSCDINEDITLVGKAESK